MSSTILLDVEEVSVARPDRTLFQELSLTVTRGDRVGVVGVNGSGKSTLLRVLTGDLRPDSGQVRRGRDIRIASLDQRPDLMAPTVKEAIGEGWQAASVADRLGVSPLLDRAPAGLSGGEAKRVALAVALSVDADLLVLDEPTNHLDLAGIEWLEQSLARATGGLVVVSHDRVFLDRVTNRILALERGEWFLVDRGYQAYLDALASRVEQAAQQEASRRILARQELAWLRRGARERRRKPKSRLAVARAIVDGAPGDHSARDGGAMQLREFGAARLGRLVVELRDVAFAHHGQEPLFSGVELSLDPRARLGVIGPNGAGKSTLLDIIAGRLRPTEGEVVTGSTVELGYFDQHGADLPDHLVVREVVAGPHQPPGPEHAALLRRFWFDDDTHYSPVGLLSGGERRRLELVRVLAGQPNVLLLDEPTNDLDLDTLRTLEAFLEDWPGALVAVTHDRAFLERVAEHVLVLADGSVTPALGGAAVWQHVPAPGGPGAPPAVRPDRGGDHPGPASTARRRTPYTLARLIGQVDRRLAELGRRRAAVEADLAAATGHQQLGELGEELARLAAEEQAVEDEWLALAAEAEEATPS